MSVADLKVDMRKYRYDDDPLPFFSLFNSADLMIGALWRLDRLTSEVALGRTMPVGGTALFTPGYSWNINEAMREYMGPAENPPAMAGPPPEWAADRLAPMCLDMTKLEDAILVLDDDTLLVTNIRLEQLLEAQTLTGGAPRFWEFLNADAEGVWEGPLCEGSECLGES